jgi:hypothetical protein
MLHFVAVLKLLCGCLLWLLLRCVYRDCEETTQVGKSLCFLVRQRQSGRSNYLFFKTTGVVIMRRRSYSMIRCCALRQSLHVRAAWQRVIRN